MKEGNFGKQFLAPSVYHPIHNLTGTKHRIIRIFFYRHPETRIQQHISSYSRYFSTDRTKCEERGLYQHGITLQLVALRLNLP